MRKQEGKVVMGNTAQHIAHSRERYQRVQQRVLRHPPYCAHASKGYERQELTRIESILAGGARPGMASHVLGFLIKLDADTYCLEDLTGRLTISLRHAEPCISLLAEGCIVIAVGHVAEADDSAAPLDYVLEVVNLLSPIPETRAESERLFAGLSRTRFGLPPLSHEDLQIVQGLEMDATEVFFVVLSDVHLDQPHCVDKLAKLFAGFAATPPAVMLLLGSFTSKPFVNRCGADAGNQCTKDDFVRLMDKLSDLIAAHPTYHERTRFVLVPGPNDPCATGGICYPKPGLPALFKMHMLERIGDAQLHFASNPTRLFFHSQEMCVFRDNLLHKMLKQCASKPEDASPTELVVRAVLDQAHLLPLPQFTSPVFFGQADALNLFPLPSVLVLAADVNDPFFLEYCGCGVLNPGSFAADASFVVYRPSSMSAEFSRVS